MKFMMMVLFVGCKGSGPAGAIDCGVPSEQIFPAADETQLTEQEGALDDVLVGLWQHIYVFDLGLGEGPISTERTDIRFAFPTNRSVIYCQDVEDPDVDGDNASTFTIDDDTLQFGPGYTALAWTSDEMIWRNEFFEDREQLYLLRRIR